MNGIQSGTPSNQLSPQSFKNSSQSGTLQSGSNLQYSGTQSSVLQVETNSAFVLKVDDTTQGRIVLGANTGSSTSSVDSVAAVANPSTNYSFLIFIIIVGFFLSLHFATKALAIKRVDTN